MKIESKIIFIATFIISILVYQLWKPLLNCCDIKIFYPGIALMILGYSIIIYSECKGKFKMICEAFMWLAVNNFLDELIFDPTHLQKHEYVAFLIIIFNLLYKWIRYKRKF